MGGGGAIRAAAKVAGITAASSGFRSVTAEHARNVVRPVAVSAISSSSSDDVKSGVVGAASRGDVSAVQKVASEFDDWEMAFDEEPLPRVVFGGAPSLEEATEATSDLKEALEKVYLPQPSSEYGGSYISGSSLLPFSKACVVSDAVVTPSAPKHAVKAFRFLNESPAAQTVVASIACDPKVWNAVLQNPALQEFLESQKTSEQCASFPGTDGKIEDSATDADSLSQLSPRGASAKSAAEESKSGNFLTGLLQDVKQTVINMMNSLSDYFNNLFGGNNVFVDSDGTAKLGAVEKTLGASLMGLAVMVIMVVVLKRN